MTNKDNVNNNDASILELRKQIEEKRLAIGKVQRYRPITNSSLELNNKTYNIHVLTKESLVLIACNLHALKTSADALGYELIISNYSVNDWLSDVNQKISIFNVREEQKKLDMLQERLGELLSEDKKVSLELDSIKDILNNI